MKKTEIIDWLKSEFSAVQLATTNETLSQIVDNTIRYWNTHSAYKWVRMYTLSNLEMENDKIGLADGERLTYSLTTTYQGVLASNGISIQIEVGESTITITDDGAGVLSGTYETVGDITGTIVYASGVITLAFPVAPNEDSSFRATYYFVAQGATSAAPNTSGGGTAVPIPPEFKNVSEVYPAVSPQLLWQDNTLWKLFGITILDNVTSDLIMMTQAFQNYQIYVGTDFRWTYNRSESPDEYGQLLYTGNPYNNARICVVGSKKILPNEDIKGEHILDWLLYYAKGLLKMCEGNMLRKADIIGVRNDGQQLYNEGKEEKTYMEKRLSEEGRWLVMGRRM